MYACLQVAMEARSLESYWSLSDRHLSVSRCGELNSDPLEGPLSLLTPKNSNVFTSVCVGTQMWGSEGRFQGLFLPFHFEAVSPLLL